MKRIALDLDGVLADFYGKLAELGLKKDRTLWANLEKIPNFFLTLKPKEDAHQLFKFVKEADPSTIILTALPYPTGYLRTSADDKRIWVHKHFDKDVNVVTVVGGKHKARYATPNTILIDDLERNIDNWKAAGGIGILHKNTETTIAELQLLL